MILENVTAEGAYAVVVSDSLEIVLFGIYSILFTFALIILTVYRRPLPVDWLMVVALCSLFVICLSHCSLVTTDRYSTLGSAYPMPKGPEMSGVLRGADIVLKVAAFLSQLIMIHRCWAVWDRSLCVVWAPAILALAGFACAMIGPVSIPASDFHSPFVAPRTLLFDTVFCALSLVVDTLVTTLIIYRLRRLSAPARSFKSISDLVFSLATCVIEAGALLAFAQLALLVFFVLEHPAVIIMESIAAQIYVRIMLAIVPFSRPSSFFLTYLTQGIAPTMMIIRLGISLLPEGRVRWASTVPEFSTVVVGTTFTTDSDIELADTFTPSDFSSIHSHLKMS
ncbi:hypothetical protein BV20DRAFT_1065800 [Pilatotrama ljubarskyi]|nr:hypothetical protein BV20DRAFT_1065800 [Pilatotrama ljubarskyi]